MSTEGKLYLDSVLLLTEAKVKIQEQQKTIEKLEKEVEYFKTSFEKYVSKWAEMVERDINRFYQNVN